MKESKEETESHGCSPHHPLHHLELTRTLHGKISIWSKKIMC